MLQLLLLLYVAHTGVNHTTPHHAGAAQPKELTQAKPKTGRVKERVIETVSESFYKDGKLVSSRSTSPKVMYRSYKSSHFADSWELHHPVEPLGAEE